MSQESLRYGLHHVQISIPAGGEERARSFYVAVLGLVEVPKPPVLAARGGLWVRGAAVELHLGIEPDFRPATKAHPGILVSDLDAFVARLASFDVPVTRDDNFPGYRRCYAADPFGNRLEFLQPIA